MWKKTNLHTKLLKNVVVKCFSEFLEEVRPRMGTERTRRRSIPVLNRWTAIRRRRRRRATRSTRLRRRRRRRRRKHRRRASWRRSKSTCRPLWPITITYVIIDFCLARIFQKCKNISKIFKNFQKFKFFSKIQKIQKKISFFSQKFNFFSKIQKLCKNCSKIQKFFKNSKNRTL